jgi:hypothetical protein
MKGLTASGEKGMLEIMAVTHAGMTTDAFAKTVSDWLISARHPRFDRPYDRLVYPRKTTSNSFLRVLNKLSVGRRFLRTAPHPGNIARFLL